jgi:anthranilate/para-aminobenzoate synthase component I
VNDNLYSVFYLAETKDFLLCSKPKKAFIHYRDFKIDLLTSERIDEPIEAIKHPLESISINSWESKPIVFHLFYEAGFLFQGKRESIPEHDPLLIHIEYLDAQNFKKEEHSSKLNLKLLEYPSLKSYKKKFKKVQKHLVDGDCYQVNLTHPFFFKSKEKLESKDYLNHFISNKENLGAYAHFTYINVLDKVFLSNSPECLFKAYERNNKSYLRSMPIKGTISDSISNAWEKLQSSKKDEGELYMITDLIRNDLTKINLSPSRVLYKKKKLIVPNIIHQFSVVEVELDPGVTLYQVLFSLFPGGSITGAPKKRVMEIIAELEDYKRGFYCGSTVLLHKSMRCASINIRSAEISLDRNEIKYGSGGGVTLLSGCKDEFDESYQKMHSFLKFLGTEDLNKS